MEVEFKTAIKDLAELAEVAPDDHKTPLNSQTDNLPSDPPRPTHRLPGRNAQGNSLYELSILSSSAGQQVRDYLEIEHGLWPETWQHFSLGDNPVNLYDTPAKWELIGKNIWLPRRVVSSPDRWRGNNNRRPLSRRRLLFFTLSNAPIILL